MRILVTGGTGLLGNTILRQLTGSEHHLIALVRGQSDPEVFEGIDTELIAGDLLDPEAVFEAVLRCDAVIHSAGLIHLGWQRRDESMQVNRDGTRLIVDACLKHDCKLVHVGTVNTLAVGSRDLIADEDTPLDHAGGQVPCSYVDSKRAGVSEVQRGVKQGLDAVIVHPGFMLGPWDWKPSSGRMLVEVGRGWKPIAPSGGCSLCDSRDVASGVIAALQRRVESGREYILAGTNWRYIDLWTEMARRMGARPPWMRAGPLQRWMGSVAGDLWSRIAEESDLNGAAVRMSSQYHWYDSSRAGRELGYETRDSCQTLDDAARWIRDHHSPS